ncbi:MAG: nucleolar RNA-binding Nop10p family protein [Promethearchaeota archaeon]
MTKHLQKCAECKEYGLANPEFKCRLCGGKLENVKPPKFSLNDKFGKYRIKYFKEEFEKKYK